MSESETLGVYKDLPKDHIVLIGKLVTSYAYMERYLITIVYGVAGLSREMGDLVVRQPRLDDVFDMIDDICTFKGIELNQDSFKSLRSRALSIKKLRDAVAHNTFVHHPDFDDPVMVSLRGNWNKTDRKKAGHKSKAVRPLGAPLPLETLLNYNKGLDELTKDLTDFMRQLGLDS